MENATLGGTAQGAHFGTMAGDWWNPAGSSAMLHRLNPVRLRYIRDQIDRHWHGDGRTRTPLTGKRALDMGCGAGLLAEPLARLGAAVTGVDAAHENIAAARDHAAQSGLTIDYRDGDLTAIAGQQYDLITCLEVIEHVTHPAAFIAGLMPALAPGGLMILSTPNRTALSRLAIVGIGETLGGIPKGTHDWHAFVTPDELTVHLHDAGLVVIDISGIAMAPDGQFKLSRDLRLDYLVTAVAGAR
jgi:2-polyprenyl-6-hydroxyphenyl methylase / 3-demethylubiquinone-9 3-methyltransferase